METIQQIIVPVDFHQHTDELVDFSLNIASRLGAKITFLHVAEHITEVAGYVDVYPASFKEIDEEIFSYAQKKMSSLVEKSKGAGPGCDGVVLRGDVVDCIVDHVRDKESGLIVMGTHGAKGIEKIMMGSVAERVLKRASCPILVVNPYRGERGYQVNVPVNEAVEPV
jgi:nucleotide-binding universal stress UspA family protein